MIPNVRPAPATRSHPSKPPIRANYARDFPQSRRLSLNVAVRPGSQFHPGNVQPRFEENASSNVPFFRGVIYARPDPLLRDSQHHPFRLQAADNSPAPPGSSHEAVQPQKAWKRRGPADVSPSPGAEGRGEGDSFPQSHFRNGGPKRGESERMIQSDLPGCVR